MKPDHDDVIKWKHFPRYWSWLPANSPYKGQWRGAWMFSLICTWINGCVNNRAAGDLRRHRAHYDVSVMYRWLWRSFKILRPRQICRHFEDDVFKCIFLNENAWISLNFVPKFRIDNIPALVQIMTWCQLGDKPLSEPMVICLLTDICVTLPQWVKSLESGDTYTFAIELDHI